MEVCGAWFARGRAPGRPVAAMVMAGILSFVALMRPAAVHGQESTSVPLGTCDQVRRLTPEQAARHLPVRLTGVVTYHDPALYSRFVQDETAGIYFQETTNMPPLRVGQRVEIEGETGAGEFAPIVMPRSVRVLGDAPWPVAKVATMDGLASGREDSQWVEIAGTVRSVR